MSEPPSKKQAEDADPANIDIESCIDNPKLAPLGAHLLGSRSNTPDKGRHSKASTSRDGVPLRNESAISGSLRVADAPAHATLASSGGGAGITSLLLRRRNLTADELRKQIDILLLAQAPGEEERGALEKRGLALVLIPPLRLTELDLSRNRLEDLPSNFAQAAPHLRYLNLSMNRFTRLPRELFSLARLEVLLLSQNRIRDLPAQFPAGFQNLKTLKLCANEISQLPEWIGRLAQLQTLTLGSVFGGNRISVIPPGCLSRMLELRELDLSHNLLSRLPDDLGHPLSKLVHLTVASNRLESLPRTIGLCRNLRALDLSRNQLTSLPLEMVDLANLDTLDVSDNLLCVIPGDVSRFMERTTFLLTGNPFTRGYCDQVPANYPGATGARPGPAQPTIPSATGASSAAPEWETLVRDLSRRPIPIRIEYDDIGEEEGDASIDHHLHHAQAYSTPGTPTQSRSLSPGPIARSSSGDYFGPAARSTEANSFGISRSVFSSPTSSPHLGSTSPTLPAAGEDEGRPWLPSLKELAARTILLNELPIPRGLLPTSLLAYLQPGARPCCFCQNPYVKEWVSAVTVEDFRGHPSVVHKVRFCSARCWSHCRRPRNLPEPSREEKRGAENKQLRRCLEREVCSGRARGLNLEAMLGGLATEPAEEAIAQTLDALTLEEHVGRRTEGAARRSALIIGVGGGGEAECGGSRRQWCIKGVTG
ncbi:uncharacterized protein VTP21DRAFT_4732 [Calcarisporiella thermophila]|uniref:uncharacterized protein n=1 Tax=Calcarisporiella thermophila TaxID=911321 RepID=UPI0037421777